VFFSFFSDYNNGIPCKKTIPFALFFFAAYLLDVEEHAMHRDGRTTNIFI
jgi:hypothetical protein